MHALIDHAGRQHQPRGVPGQQHPVPHQARPHAIAALGHDVGAIFQPLAALDQAPHRRIALEVVQRVRDGESAPPQCGKLNHESHGKALTVGIDSPAALHTAGPIPQKKRCATTTGVDLKAILDGAGGQRQYLAHAETIVFGGLAFDQARLSAQQGEHAIGANDHRGPQIALVAPGLHTHHP